MIIAKTVRNKQSARYRKLAPLLLFVSQLAGLLDISASADTTATNYCLDDLNGVAHCANDYNGKWLVINFWATWCPPCIAEMPELEKFYRENKSRAEVWGVTFEDTDKARILEFVEKIGVTYPILGPGQDPLTGFGSVTVLPTTFVIDRDGKFRYRFEGPIEARDIEKVIE